MGATVDFKNRICTADYLKCWIGGHVEKEIVTFSIKWKEEVEDDIDISYVTVCPAEND